MNIVAKFGGSSLASAEQFKKVADIIRADNDRRFVVPSAPGKRNDDDDKVTDLLYSAYEHAAAGLEYKPIMEKIKNRYKDIIKGLELDLSLDEEFDTIEDLFIKKAGKEYAASRGEYLNGIIMSRYMDFPFIDAAKVIFFNEDGTFDSEYTDRVLSKTLEGLEHAVIPGFYGADHSGNIRTFSRGGSDITGSIVSRAARADMYENWTDVSGFLVTDPRIIRQPEVIDTITYRELRELSYMGASVLHEEAVFPVALKKIPIQIRNTNKPEDVGTIINNSDEGAFKHIITGIAGKKDFSIITIRKVHMSNEVGLIRKALSVFEDYNVSIEHIPSGVDSFSVVVETKAVKPFVYELMGKLKKATSAGEVTLTSEISLIATVGLGMKNYKGLSGRLFSAIGKAGINIVVISQTSDEINIIVGVHNSDYEKTIRTIYYEFNPQ